MAMKRLESDSLSFTHSIAVVAADGQMTYRDNDTALVWPLASVTKPLAAWGVLVAIERGLVDLDDRVEPFDVTVCALLAHASGLPVDGQFRRRIDGAIRTTGYVHGQRSDMGRTWGPDSDEPITPPRYQPYERRIYSNYGYEVLARFVERRVKMPIGAWTESQVFRPLGMVSSTLPGSPAHGAFSNVQDLRLFVRELMNPRLISPDLAAYAQSVQYSGLPGLLPGYGMQKNNAWGLGVEIRDSKQPHWLAEGFSPRTFGHFGISGSFIWVDPDLGKAGIFLGDHKFGREHSHAWPAITAEMRTK